MELSRTAARILGCASGLIPLVVTINIPYGKPGNRDLMRGATAFYWEFTGREPLEDCSGLNLGVTAAETDDQDVPTVFHFIKKRGRYGKGGVCVTVTRTETHDVRCFFFCFMGSGTNHSCAHCSFTHPTMTRQNF